MGIFLSSIREESKNLARNEWAEPLQRIKQYHGLFKSVCETFVIRKNEFDQIFGVEDDKFKIWDRDSTGKVDALQLFCGLVYYASESTWQAKLKMLFMLFDFNEIKSLSLVDLEYMVLCVCNSTYKILDKNAHANQLEISDWLAKTLNPNQRINITKLQWFLSTSSEAKEFFRLTGVDVGPQLCLGKTLTVTNHNARKSDSQNQQLQRESAEITNKLNWLNGVNAKITKVKQNNHGDNYTCKIEWVYGIRIQGLKRPFVMLDHRLVYSVGSLMVVYSDQNNIQAVYQQHEHDITTFCVHGAESKQLVASVERSTPARIHIWDAEILEIVQLVVVLHDCVVSVMEFMEEDKLLATIGQRVDSPMLIYSVDTGQLRHSFRFQNEITALITFFSPIDPVELQYSSTSTFACLSQHSISMVQQYSETPLISVYEYHDHLITCAVLIQVNSDYIYLRALCNTDSLALYIVTGHSNGAIRSLCYNKANRKFEQGTEITKLSQSIQCLQITQQALFVAAGGEFLVYSLAGVFKEDRPQALRVISLREHAPGKCMGAIIKHFELSRASLNGPAMIVLTTQAGDFLRIGDRQVYSSGDSYCEMQQLSRLTSLCKFSLDMGAICLIEEQGEQVLLVVSGGNKLYQISPASHQIATVWEVAGQQFITVVEAGHNDEGICYVICGCRSGRLLIRLDWEENPKICECGAAVVTARLSKDTNYLLVATSDNYVLFFSQGNHTFSSPRKLHFENEAPTAINFMNNYKFFTVSTSALNVYLVEIPQLKHRNLQKDVDALAVSKMLIECPVINAETDLQPTKVVLGGDMKYVLLCLAKGKLLFFDKLTSLSNRSYRTFQVHQGAIEGLLVAEDQKMFWTLCSVDRMLVQWRANSFPSQQGYNHRVLEGMKEREVYDDNQFRLMKSLSGLTTQQEKLARSTAGRTVSTVDYRFIGTSIDKLNQSLHRATIGSGEMNSDGGISIEARIALQKRRSNIVLKTEAVFGYEYGKANLVRYYNQTSPEDNRIIYQSSRFLLLSETNPNQKATQTILEHSQACISYYQVNSQTQQILFAECGPSPRIGLISRLQQCRWLNTTHQLGILHFQYRNNLILSYGSLKQGYSLNLHNYCTGQLLIQRTTELQLEHFIMLDDAEFISLCEVRRWKDMVCSQVKGHATAAVLLPDEVSVCFGNAKGELLILYRQKLEIIVQRAHDNKIQGIAVQAKSVQEFKVITAGLDECVKIWDNHFQEIFFIDLRSAGLELFTPLKESVNSLGSVYKRWRMLQVCSLDCKDNRVLLGFVQGEIYEILLIPADQALEGKAQTQRSLESASDSSIESSCMTTRRQALSYQFTVSKVLDSHCSMIASSYYESLDKSIFNLNPNSSPNLTTNPDTGPSRTSTSNLSRPNSQLTRSVFFDLHSTLPLMVSSSPDNHIIFRAIPSGHVLSNYIWQHDDNPIRALRFSKVGQMLIIGFKNGMIMTYLMELVWQEHKLTEAQLVFFQCLKTKNEGSSEISSVQFSDCSTHFAVSYYSERDTGDCHIKIFKIKTEKNQSHNEAFYELKEAIYLKQPQKKQGKTNRVVTRLSFLQQQCKLYLVFYEQYFKENRQTNEEDGGRYRAYCVTTSCYVNDEFAIDWTRADVCESVGMQLVPIDASDEKEGQFGATYRITAMRRYKDSIVYGSNAGRLHIVKAHSLCTNVSLAQAKITDLFMSRTYCCHASPVVQIEVSNCGRYLYTSELASECIVQFQIVSEPAENDCDYTLYELEAEDSYGEYLDRGEFYQRINNLQPLREEITDILLDVAVDPGKDDKPQIRFQSCHAFGRRAFDRRNNLHYFKAHKAVYTIGPNIILQHLVHPPTQQLLPADPQPISHRPQISAFDYKDGLLILATEQQRARLFVWDICSKSCVASMKVECAVVYMVKLWGKEMAVLSGVNDQFILTVQLVNWRAGTVLGYNSFPHSGNWKIKDLTICNQYAEGFVSCGYCNVTLWQMRGDVLTEHSFDNIPARMFLVVRELHRSIIVGCQMGHIYLLQGGEMVGVFEDAHVGAIRAMEVEKVTGIVVTGGMDGVLHCCRLEGMELVQVNMLRLDGKVRKSGASLEGSMKDNLELENGRQETPQQSSPLKASKVYPLMYQIQSLSLLPSSHSRPPVSSPSLHSSSHPSLITLQVLVGTRSGDIYTLELDAQFECHKLCQTIHTMHQEEIVSVCFNRHKPDYFYTLTKSGLIQMWSIDTYKLCFVKHLRKQAKKIYAFANNLLICCSHQLFQLDMGNHENPGNHGNNSHNSNPKHNSNPGHNSNPSHNSNHDNICSTPILTLQPTTSATEKSPTTPIQHGHHTSSQQSFEHSSLQTGEITACVLSNNQRDLAVAVRVNPSSGFINIYDLDNHSVLFRLNNLKHEIEYLDFSVDCKFVLFKDRHEEISMIQLEDYKRINTIFVEMNIEWQKQGLRISPHGQKIYYSYSCENRILALALLEGGKIVVGDEMGTIRIFDYPCPDDRLGELHLRCYAAQMNAINNVVAHPVLPYVLTTALYDKSLVLWRVDNDQRV